MKCKTSPCTACTGKSPPSRGAWIEMQTYAPCGCEARSPPSRGAWIEIRPLRRRIVHPLSSPPSRGAWIEITPAVCTIGVTSVAPLAGGVD